MGVYDTFVIRAGEQEYPIEADYWLRQGPPPPVSPFDVGYAYYTSANQGEKVFFRYAVDNRQFSVYSADIEVSVWRSQEKLRDILAQPVSIAAFGHGRVEWSVNNAELAPANIPPEQGYQYTVVIKRGAIERKVVVSVNPTPYPVKPGQPIPAIPPR